MDKIVKNGTSYDIYNQFTDAFGTKYYVLFETITNDSIVANIVDWNNAIITAKAKVVELTALQKKIKLIK